MRELWKGFGVTTGVLIALGIVALLCCGCFCCVLLMGDPEVFSKLEEVWRN